MVSAQHPKTNSFLIMLLLILVSSGGSWCVCVEGEGKRWASFLLLWKERWTVYIISSYFTAQKNCGATFHLRNWEEKTSFLQSRLTIRLPLQLFLCGGDGGWEGEGRRGQNLNFSPGGGYNILPAIGCRNRQILCSIKTVFQNTVSQIYTGTWGQQRYIYALSFLLHISRNIWQIPYWQHRKREGGGFRSPYQATPTTPVFPNSLHGRRRRVVYLHFLPPPCRVFFPRRQSHSQSAAAAAAAFLRFGKVFPPFPYFFRGKPKHAIVIINFGFEWQVLCIACMDLSRTKKKYSLPSPFLFFCFIFKGLPCSKWVFSLWNEMPWPNVSKASRSVHAKCVFLH